MKFMNKLEATAYFESQASTRIQQAIGTFRDLNVVKIFPGRYFVVYALSSTSAVPEILTYLKVLAIKIEGGGLVVDILDTKTNVVQSVSHMPAQLMDAYQVFVSMPSECALNKVLKVRDDGSVIDGGISAILLVKHRTKPEFKNPRQINCVSIRRFEEIFKEKAEKAFELLDSRGQ